jgi:RHS repeat-associated protein
MKAAAHPTLKAHLWRFAIISLSLFGVHQNLQAKESSGMRWTVTRHTWGEDLSGTLQGAGGIGGLLRSTTAEVTTNGTPKTEHEHTFSYDSNGNVILLTNAKARETARYSYDAFGKTLTATGPAAEQNRYQFSTKPVEEESRLIYYGYRWYDPITGRWPSRDPIEERGGVNLYSFVNSEPLNNVDILGNVPYREVYRSPGLLCGGCICIVQGDTHQSAWWEVPIRGVALAVAIERFTAQCLLGGYILASLACWEIDQVYIRFGV